MRTLTQLLHNTALCATSKHTYAHTCAATLACTNRRLLPERIRCVSSSLSNDSSSSPLLVTTPIFYVNGPPHLGHLFSALLADALCRTHRLCGVTCHLTTGTDEHGGKVKQAAEREHTHPQAYTDRMSQQYRALFDRAQIHYNDYIRTTEQRHKTAVQHMWKILEDKGDIYLGEHKGWYCMADEAFVPETQVSALPSPDSIQPPRMIATDSGFPVEWRSEANFMFRLSRYQSHLLSWLQSHPEVIQPVSRYNEVLSLLTNTQLNDLSVSRLSKDMNWGIPTPNNTQHTIYVWFDALVNYLTVTGYPHNPADGVSRSAAWPADAHIIGKDILRFHTIHWPAFLMSAGLPLPRQVLVHAHWTVDKRKMSKSLNNVIDPHRLMDEYGIDAVRYFILREGQFSSDCNFTRDDIDKRTNNDLADTMGNLLQRLTSQSVLPNNIMPTPPAQDHLTPAEHGLIADICTLPEQVIELYKALQFPIALESIMELMRKTNGYVNSQQIWVLAKQKEQQPRLRTVLYCALEAVRIAALLMQPIIPTGAAHMLDKLGVKQQDRGLEATVSDKQHRDELL